MSIQKLNRREEKRREVERARLSIFVPMSLKRGTVLYCILANSSTEEPREQSGGQQHSWPDEKPDRSYIAVWLVLAPRSRSPIYQDRMYSNHSGPPHRTRSNDIGRQSERRPIHAQHICEEEYSYIKGTVVFGTDFAALFHQSCSGRWKYNINHKLIEGDSKAW